MKDLLAIAAFVIFVIAAAFATDSGVSLNFMMMALYATLLAQAWNLLGGFGGQFSFG
ncbi:MAG: branched-chain amino acid ABC transporter permease, partial [Ideonella sp.]